MPTIIPTMSETPPAFTRVEAFVCGTLLGALIGLAACTVVMSVHRCIMGCGS